MLSSVLRVKKFNVAAGTISVEAVLDRSLQLNPGH